MCFTIPIDPTVIYSVEILKITIIIFFSRYACPLCGELHIVHFHDVRKRTFRYDHKDCSFKDILCRIICYAAKLEGTQYTLTILPHFLLPGCLVRADDVFTMATSPLIRSDIKKMCDTLHVLDERTARKHLARFDACCHEHIIRQGEALSGAGADLPSIKPGECSPCDQDREWLYALSSRVIAEREKQFGYENLTPSLIALLFFFFLCSAYPCASESSQSPSVMLFFNFSLQSPRDPPEENLHQIMHGISHTRLLLLVKKEDIP